MKEYLEEDYLMLSGIQHFYFCKRQWALIHIEQQWAENQATMEGNYLHDKADNPYIVEKRKDTFISRAVPVASKYLGLSGILDVLEFKKDKQGISVEGKDGFWMPNIVEYKRGKPKKDKRDIVQLVAQVICLEEMLNCTIKKSDFFYHEINRRLSIDITDELKDETRKYSMEMHHLYELKRTPKAESYKNCQKCSLYDICLPRMTKKKVSVPNYIKHYIMEDEKDA